MSIYTEQQEEIGHQSCKTIKVLVWIMEGSEENSLKFGRSEKTFRNRIGSMNTIRNIISSVDTKKSRM